MPLSDHEQRILDEIEKNLYREDPRFARQVKEKEPPAADHRNRMKLGALCFLAGFVGLLMFFISKVLLIGVAAFAAMVLGIVLVAGAVRAAATDDGEATPAERVNRALARWEQRVRERYKKS